MATKKQPVAAEHTTAKCSLPPGAATSDDEQTSGTESDEPIQSKLVGSHKKAQAAKKAVSLVDDEAAGSDDQESAEEGDVTNYSEEESVQAVEDIDDETEDEVVVVEVPKSAKKPRGKLTRKPSVLELSQSSPDWDNDLIGLTPESPVKRRNPSGPPETPATPSPNKGGSRKKRDEHPSPGDDDSLTASPTKKSRGTIAKAKAKAKAKQDAIISDAEENVFLERNSSSSEVYIGKQRLEPVVEVSEVKSSLKKKKGKDVGNKDDVSPIAGAVYASPEYKRHPPQGNKHCLQLDRSKIGAWLKDTYKNMWPLKKYDVPNHPSISADDLVASFTEQGIQFQTAALKKTLTFPFRMMWLVNPARACPDNFGATGTGYYRPVITFGDQAVINVTFGVVEHSHLITAGEFKTGAGMRTSKSIAIIPLDVEFDLAWAFWCEALGQPELSSPAVGSNYVNFGTTMEQVDKRDAFTAGRGKVNLDKYINSPAKHAASTSTTPCAHLVKPSLQSPITVHK
ncbi:uncharacterized protein B0H18DRAFT_1126094 [Fomitopsis serialis]|uniref:uncharacterized protein n=1 Tax=Fomitopsis serialis TaxID=139415 RepID=UPI002007B51F|nr:uncharacterized protein B0H18DRAFT_1126094 [Neoantrodia serialis]KAH9913654.1 hypothetical protein B0H18DRAFT_1126094 [Neoantrodia serialis]